MGVRLLALAQHAADPSGLPGGPETGSEPTRFDFRRPSKFGREAVRRLEVAHEVFSRRIASGWGSALRAPVQFEPLGVDQVSYDDYIRSMPTPSVLATVGLAPLPGAVVLELNAQLGLVLVDRLLGGGVPTGAARATEVRRPTQLETVLLHDLLEHPVRALEEALGTIVDTTAELHALEYNPQLVQVAAPSDMVLLLSYRVTISQGSQAEGLLTVCYPSPTIMPVLDQLTTQSWMDGPDHDPANNDSVGARLDDVTLVLRAGLRETAVPARDLVALQVGDVLRLDHAASETVHCRVEGITVLEGHLCRRGRRLAVQVERWTATPGHPAAISRTQPPTDARTET